MSLLPRLPLSLVAALLLTFHAPAGAEPVRRLDGSGGGPGNDDALTISGDLDLILPRHDTTLFADTPIGVGFAGRVGWRLRAGAAFAIPELSLGLQAFPDADGFALGRGMAGLRLGIRGKVQPQLLAHVGYGGNGSGYGGVVYDLGGALDIRQRNMTFGLHGTYNALLDGAGTLSWFDFGPNISVEL